MEIKPTTARFNLKHELLPFINQCVGVFCQEQFHLFLKTIVAPFFYCINHKHIPRTGKTSSTTEYRLPTSQ